MTLIDVTVPIRADMPIYDRNPGVRLERVRSIALGDIANVSRYDLLCLPLDIVGADGAPARAVLRAR